jgi:hypothetical protein
VNRANQNAVNAFTLPFGLIFLLNNKFALQFLYPRHIFAFKDICKNKNNIAYQPTLFQNMKPLETNYFVFLALVVIAHVIHVFMGLHFF